MGDVLVPRRHRIPPGRVVVIPCRRPTGPDVDDVPCGRSEDDNDVAYACSRELGHEPPHRAVEDWRVGGYGFRKTLEWWESWGEDRASGKTWQAEVAEGGG
jgi:hypothetical protein